MMMNTITKSITKCILITVILLSSAAMSFAADWTVMVYMTADNNLEEVSLIDFEKMAQVGSDDNLNIVVVLDRSASYDTSYGDWDNTLLFHVTKGMEPTPANAVADLGEWNMGSSESLAAFIFWSQVRWPADNYALILWDHGNGWYPMYVEEAVTRSVSLDDDPEDALSLAELRKGIEDAVSAGASPPDLIGFDACLMGMVEVGYELKDIGDTFIVHSPAVEIGDGWAYDVFLSRLKNYSTMSPYLLGKYIIDSYHTHCSDDLGEEYHTLSMTKWSVYGNQFGDHINNFVDVLDEWPSSSHNEVVTAAENLKDDLDHIIYYYAHGTSFDNDTQGLAIYLPEEDVHPDYTSNNIRFASTLWDEFLDDFTNDRYPDWVTGSTYGVKDYSMYAWYADEWEHLDLYEFLENIIMKVPDDPEPEPEPKGICGVSPMYRDGTAFQAHETVSIGKVALPVVPSILGLCFWAVAAFVNRKKRHL